MTFTIMLKDEISKNESNPIEKRIELISFINASSRINNDEIIITSENASVIRKIYKEIKEFFLTTPNVMVRRQKRFKEKQIYILTIKEKIEFIKGNLNYDIKTFLSNEEKIAFLKGTFLAIGSISDPKTSGYHLEFSASKSELAEEINQILKSFKFNSNIVKRGYKHVVYLKSSENISDLIKLFKTNNSLFYFEDIRIYRDHKNMVNRLNNCEIANQEKTIKTGLKQLENINYLKENDLLDLFDDNAKIVITMREKYPEASFQELSEIISMETNYKIGKSGINHHFIKINDIINKHKKVGKNE